MLKRKIYDELLDWKHRSNGQTALLIDGARRVGKSFIVEKFAQQEYKSHIIIDFGNAPQDILELFIHDSSDLDLFFAKLSAFYSTVLHKRKSLIVFDEIQQFPRARQLIKYLVKDGRYDFLETGSLIRLKKNTENIIIPSEEEHKEMFPLDFEEFLWAMGDEATVPLIRQCFEKKIPLGQTLHRKIMNDFRQYMLVGGMPSPCSLIWTVKILGLPMRLNVVSYGFIGRMSPSLPQDMRRKYMLCLTASPVSSPRRKRNIHYPQLARRPVFAAMKILLSG